MIASFFYYSVASHCVTWALMHHDNLPLMVQKVKHLPAMPETWIRSLGGEDPLEKEMATHCSTLAWKIPWTEKPGRLQFTGSQRVGHDWATSLSLSLWLTVWCCILETWTERPWKRFLSLLLVSYPLTNNTNHILFYLYKGKGKRAHWNSRTRIFLTVDVKKSICR